MAVGDHSKLGRFQPRHAAVAATSSSLQHQQVVQQARKMALRRQLPMTQDQFYAKQQASQS